MLGVMWKMCEIESGSSSLSCGRDAAWVSRGRGARCAWLQHRLVQDCANGKTRTGTFFWVMTTDASSPRMAIVVWPDEVIALNAYSAHDRVSGMPQQLSSTPRTDLVETALGGEDGEVPVGRQGSVRVAASYCLDGSSGAACTGRTSFGS